MLGSIPQSPDEWFSMLPTIFLVIACIPLVFVILMFLVAFLERRHLRAMRPLSPSDPASRTAAPAAVEAGCAAEFNDMGRWTDSATGVTREVCTLMLSGDGLALLQVLHGKLAGRFRLITRLSEARWLITSSMSGEPDLSGFEDEQMLSGKAFYEIVAAHSARVSASPFQAIPFSREHIAQEMLEHEQARVGRLIANGLAKRLAGPDERWHYTLRGAFRVASAGLRNLQRAQQAARQPRPASALDSPLGRR